MSNTKSSSHSINLATRTRASNSHSQNESGFIADSMANQEDEQQAGTNNRNTPPLLLTLTRDLHVGPTRLGSKVTTIQGIDLEGDKLEYSLRPAQYHDASPYFHLNSTSGELRLISRPPSNGTEIYFLNVVTSDDHYNTVTEFRVHVSRKGGAEDDQEEAEKSMMAKTSEFLANLYSTDHRPGPINNSSIMLPPIYLNPPITSIADKRQEAAQVSPPIPQQSSRRPHPRPRPTTQHPLRLPLRQQAGGSPSNAATMMPQLGPSEGLAPVQNLTQQQVLFSIIMVSLSFITIACLTIMLVVRLKRRLKTVERQHERLSKKLSDGSCSMITNSRLGSTTNDTDQSMTNYDFNGLNSQSGGGGGISVYLDEMSNERVAHQIQSADTNSYANNTFVSNNIYCPVDDEFYSTITTESSLVDNQKIAAHNYNLYTMQRARQQQQQPDRHQVSSLVGQIVDSRINTVAGCAQPISQFACERIGTSPCESPELAGSLRSSTRSLAQFLSMPNRHLSHQNAEGAERVGRSLLEELNQDFDAMAQVVENNLQSKTIARANRIGREQQVPHKRDRTQPDEPTPAGDTVDRWEIDRDRLEPLNILGQGQFGQVWRYKLKVHQGTMRYLGRVSELTVAVKTLKKSAARDARACDELRAEIEIMKLVCNHPNVVRILHCCTSDVPNKPILLVMEHVDLGNLQSFMARAYQLYAAPSSASLQNHASSLHLASIDPDYRLEADSVLSAGSTQYDNNYTPMPMSRGMGARAPRPASDELHHQLTSRELIKFCYHVAKGMEYVSSSCIVHRDLASRNILINSQHVCKIGDFGMARNTANMSNNVYERRSQNAMVAVRWMAPEALLANTFTTKSDVFSFGILMWEIVTLGETPYRHLETQEIVQAVAVRGERPERPKHCHELLYEIMSRCWSVDPSERPSFQELAEQLDGLLMSTEEYIQLDHFPENKYYNQMTPPFELL